MIPIRVWRFCLSHPFQAVLAVLLGALAIGQSLNNLRFIEPSIQPQYADIFDPTPVHMTVWNDNGVGLSEVRIDCSVFWMRAENPETGFRGEFSDLRAWAHQPEHFLVGGGEKDPHVALSIVPEESKAIAYLGPHTEPEDLNCGITVYRIDEMVITVTMAYRVNLLPKIGWFHFVRRHYRAARSSDGKLRWLPARVFGSSTTDAPLPYPSMSPWFTPTPVRG
jgi:hypothetical protein